MKREDTIGRREILQMASAGMVVNASRVGMLHGESASPSASSSPSESHSPTANDLNEYLRSLCEVNSPSVDRVILGDPNTEIAKIGTAWMPYWKTCRAAVSEGINVLVVHEPTFYTHWDLDEKENDYYQAPEPGKSAYLQLRDEKRQWILERKLVIIRCHDVWDKMSGIGIPFAFGNALGFSNEEIVRSKPYYNVYRIQPQSALQVARGISAQLKNLGQAGVAFYGDPERRIESVGVGTGCICDPIQFMDLKPDLFIAIDDSIRTWTQTVYAEDSGHPLVVVNHGTSEEFGMRLLRDHLQSRYPHIAVVHLNQGCGYRWIPA